jgi:hypothetical protein
MPPRNLSIVGQACGLTRMLEGSLAPLGEFTERALHGADRRHLHFSIRGSAQCHATGMTYKGDGQVSQETRAAAGARAGYA